MPFRPAWPLVLVFAVLPCSGGCSLVRTPLVPQVDAGLPDVPGLDAPIPDVPGLDVPDAFVPPDVPIETDSGCSGASRTETACDRVDDDCDGVIDDDGVCDGCLAITVSGRAYLSCPPASGLEAWSGACGSHAPGYQLVSFGASEQTMVLAALAAASITDTHWIGLNDFDENGTYVWFDRSTTFTPTTIGADDPAKRCVQLRPTGEYEELPCSDSHRVLCEAVVAPGACRGLAEASGCNGVDENCNGQVDEGFNCGEDCDNLTFWDSVYYVCGAGTDWDGAAATCTAATGGALTVFTSDVERLVVGAASPEVWIGLRQAAGSASPSAGWSWTGSSSTYTLPPAGPPWDGGSGGQPDDDMGIENDEQNCGSMRMDDRFEDDACSDTHDFVCERRWTY